MTPERAVAKMERVLFAYSVLPSLRLAVPQAAAESLLELEEAAQRSREKAAALEQELEAAKSREGFLETSLAQQHAAQEAATARLFAAEVRLGIHTLSSPSHGSALPATSCSPAAPSPS